MKALIIFGLGLLLSPFVSFAATNSLTVCALGQNIIDTTSQAELAISFMPKATGTPAVVTNVRFNIGELPPANNLPLVLNTKCEVLNNLPAGYYYYSTLTMPAGYSAKYNDQDIVITKTTNDYFIFDRKGNTNSDGIIEIGGSRPNRFLELLVINDKTTLTSKTHKSPGGSYVTPQTGSNLIDIGIPNKKESSFLNSSNIEVLGSTSIEVSQEKLPTSSVLAATINSPLKTIDNGQLANVGSLGINPNWLWLLLLLPLLSLFLILSRDKKNYSFSLTKINENWHKLTYKVLKTMHML